jgi:hypothetical protein
MPSRSWKHGQQKVFGISFSLSHYAFGEMDCAAAKYKLAIESSKKHRFVHEEAVACEQAAAFHEEVGNKDLADELMRRALKCYQTWGAEKKVDSLLEL